MLLNKKVTPKFTPLQKGTIQSPYCNPQLKIAPEAYSDTGPFSWDSGQEITIFVNILSQSKVHTTALKTNLITGLKEKEWSS